MLTTIKYLYGVLLLFVSLTAIGQQPQNMTLVQEGRDGLMYFASHTGLHKFDGTNFHKVESIKNQWVYELLADDSKSHLYIGTGNSTLKYSVLTGHVEVIAEKSGHSMAINSSHLFVADETGVSAYNLRTKTSKALLTGQRVIRLISYDNQVFALTNNGLWQIDATYQLQLVKQKIKYGRLAAFGDNLFFTNGSSLYTYSLLTQNVAHFELHGTPSAIATFKGNYLALAISGDVSLYSHTGQKVIANAINQEPLFFNYLFVDSKNNVWAVADNDFEVISQDFMEYRLPLTSRYNVIGESKSKVYVGTDRGVFEFVERSFKGVELLNDKLRMKNALEVTDLVEFAGSTYIGTVNGLYKWRDSDLSKLSDGYILQLSVYSGLLYAATSGQGLVIFNANSQPVEQYSLKSGLASNEVLSSVQKGNSLYISTSRGLQVVNRAEGSSKLMLESIEGKVSQVVTFENEIYVAVYGSGLYKLQNGEFFKLSGPRFITELMVFDGAIVAATSNGLFILKDSNLVILPRTEKLYFATNSLLNHRGDLFAVTNRGLLEIRQLTPSKANNLGITAIVKNGELVSNLSSLSHNEVLKVYLAVDDYSLAKYYQYEYRHDGGAWLKLDSPSVTLSRLEIGKHSLEFRATIDGVNFTKTQSLQWHVNGPFYRSSGFFFGAVIAVVLTVLTIAMMGIRRLQQMRTVYRRVRNTNQQTALSLGFRKLVSGSSLCQGSPVQVSDGLVHLDEAKDLLLPIVYAHGALGNNDLNDGLNMLHANTSMQYPNIDFEINMALGDKPLDEKLSQNVYAFINHALVNALKHSKAKYIEVAGKRSQNNVVITIQDNGVGISLIDKFFRFGTGLESMRDIAETLNGQLKVKRGLRNGTIVQLKFVVPEYVKKTQPQPTSFV